MRSRDRSRSRSSCASATAWASTSTWSPPRTERSRVPPKPAGKASISSSVCATEPTTAWTPTRSCGSPAQTSRRDHADRFKRPARHPGALPVAAMVRGARRRAGRRRRGRDSTRSSTPRSPSPSPPAGRLSARSRAPRSNAWRCRGPARGSSPTRSEATGARAGPAPSRCLTSSSAPTPRPPG
jgi:hypothetical protein